jgi:hypothetical protein
MKPRTTPERRISSRGMRIVRKRQVKVKTTNKETTGRSTEAGGRIRQQRLKGFKGEEIGTESMDVGRIAEAWGDTMAYETEYARVIYQNSNGIKYANDFGDCAIIGDAAREMGASVIGLAETCLDWSNQETMEKCKRMFRTSFNPQINRSVSSSEETYDTPYQPGGTATLVGGNWAGRTTSHCDNSGMGRWSEIRMAGKDNTAIRFITAYRVVDTSFARAGPTTAYSQQVSIMEDKGVIDPDPRAAVLHDLGKHIENAIEQGDEVCLMIDANESMCDRGEKFSKWVHKTGLCDIMVQRHGTEKEPATFIGGSKRIDYILVTEKLTEYVAAAGILEENEFYESDHRALYVDLDLEAFLGGSPSPMEARIGKQRSKGSEDLQREVGKDAGRGRP